METVYLETTFISYLAALPSRDLIVAAHQQITSDWWTNRRHLYDCFASEIVIDEASAGDDNEVEKRLAILSGMSVLDVTDDSALLTKSILGSGALPEKAVRDAAHIAVAAIHNIDFLLTWNCKHLANAHIMRRVEKVCQSSGFQMPMICTPEELMENDQ